MKLGLKIVSELTPVARILSRDYGLGGGPPGIGPNEP